MPGYRISIDLSDVARRWARLGDEFRKALSEELDRVGGEMEAEAKRLVPVRTGYLRSTIYHRTEGLRMDFGAAASYALFVELGTRRMQPRPFIRPAFESHRGSLRFIPLKAWLRMVRSRLAGLFGR